MKVNRVYLIGAGAGDIELLTLKAVNILKQADVVLYDALINEDIFEFCKSDVKKVNVGKRKGKHLLPQNEINKLILEYAKENEVVVRLKGGTPFVFGRGFEEVRFLRSHGIEPTVISGVSSTTAVPEFFMIPLIDRNYSDSYRTITGHNIETFNDIVTPFNKRENLIILMGAHNTKEIVEILIEKKSYPSETPIAFMSRGYFEDNKIIISTLGEVNQKDEAFFNGLRNLTPLIIFVGETIKCSL